MQSWVYSFCFAYLSSDLSSLSPFLTCPPHSQPSLICLTTCQSHLDQPQSTSLSKSCPLMGGHQSQVLFCSGGKQKQTSGKKSQSQFQVENLPVIVALQLHIMSFLRNQLVLPQQKRITIYSVLAHDVCCCGLSLLCRSFNYHLAQAVHIIQSSFGRCECSGNGAVLKHKHCPHSGTM